MMVGRFVSLQQFVKQFILYEKVFDLGARRHHDS